MMRIFAQIQKVDEARREVWGRAVQETPDRSDEIFDYETSKPHFQNWSKSFHDATDGKSLGNIRAMHGKVAAGKAIKVDFNDEQRAIDIGAKIVDDDSWTKVLEGVYTGFSIGGSYVDGSKKTEKNAEGKELTRYTAIPAEISLVDLPCIPTATFFDVVKIDGTLHKIAFKNPDPAGPAADPATSQVAKADEGGGGQEPAAKAEEIEVHAAPDEIAATEELAKLLNDGAVKATDLLAVAKRDFTTKERATAAKDGAAMPDGSFPIENLEDLHNAIQAVGRAKDESAAKAHIITRAKALGATDELPASWSAKEKAADGELKKGMWNVQDFSNVLCSIASIAQGAQYDLESEGDGSPIPKQLRQWVADGISIFKDMAKEEADEMMESLNATAGVSYVDGVEVPIEAAARAEGLRKALATPDISVRAFRELALKHVDAAEWAEIEALDHGERIEAVVAKAGARHSANDLKRLQKAHDMLTELGAKCGQEAAAATGDMAKAADETKEQLAKALARIDALEKQPVPQRHVTLRVVGKTADTRGADAASDADLEQFIVRNADGTLNPAASVIKYQQSLPGEPVDPRLR
jgi:hypothetical protein